MICPACFASDVDTSSLHTDRKNGQLYCIKCTYVADSKEEVREFFNSFIKQRYGIDRYEPLVPEDAKRLSE